MARAWVGGREAPWAVNSDPTPPSTYEMMGAWNLGDGVQKVYRDAASVRNFSRRGAWGALAPRPMSLGARPSASSPSAGAVTNALANAPPHPDPPHPAPPQRHVAFKPNLEQSLRKCTEPPHAVQCYPVQVGMPGGTGSARLAYMQPELVPGRLFNVASRGLPSGAQPKWSFDRMPSLLPPPLLRDRGVARSCAGVAARTESQSTLPRAQSNPELAQHQPSSGVLPPLIPQRVSAASLRALA